MARRTARFERVQAVLPKMMKSLGLKKEYKARLVLFYWEKIVGAEIAAQVRPMRVSFRTLFVTAKSSVWANQIMLMKLDILAQANRFIGENLLTDLRLGQPKDEEKEADALAEYQESLGRKLRKVSLAENERKRAKKACEAVHDEPLRAMLCRVYQHQMRLEKLERSECWHACAKCGVLCPEKEPYCTVCTREIRQQKEAKIREILTEIPWARYTDIYQAVDCTPQMVNQQKIRMLQKMAAKISPEDTESLEAKALVMMYRSLPPEQLTPEKITKTLYRLRNDLCRSQHFKPWRRYENRMQKKAGKK